MRNTFLIVHRDAPAAERGRAKVVKNPDWDGDWESRYFPDAPSERVSAFYIDGDEQVGDADHLYYTCEMIGGRTESCMLFVGPDISEAQVRLAEESLRQRHEIETLKHFKVTNWVA